MSDNRQLVSDIRELDKGITDCENFLAKVLNKKIETSRQPPANKKKNVPAKSSSRPQSRGGVTQTTHQRAPSAGASSMRDATRSAYPARKAPVVPSQQRKPSPDSKPRSSDGQRRRSTSVSRLAPPSCKCEPPKPVNFNKLSAHVHVPRSANTKVPEGQASKSQSPSRAVRSRSPGARNKNLPWGEILKENHQTSCKVDRGQWDIGGGFRMPGVRHPLVAQLTYSSKLPHECEPIRECSSSECTGVGSCSHFFKVTVPRRPQEESFSSEGTSGFSSNNDLPSNLTNKSVQCGSPIPGQRPKSNTDQYQHRRVSSTSSGASSQKVEEKERVMEVIGSDVFSIFNPVRTLNFLIKELQGLLQKHPKEDDSICRVIANMEKVLLRLPEGGEPAESTSGYTTRSKPHDSHSLASGSSHSCDLSEKQLDDEAQKTAILQALKTVPALARRIDERTESMRKKILEARTRVPVPSFTPTPQETYTNSVDNILRLQRYVENSGHQLEIMCQTMEQTCEFLRNERDSLQEDMEEKDKKLRVVKSQEQDFVTTVTSLRTNLESTTRRVTQLSVENKVLKEQVKEIPNLKYIEEKYKQLSTENEKLKEENKIIPVLKDSEAKVADLTSELAILQAERKSLQDMVARSNEEIQKLKEATQFQNQVGVAEATKRLTHRLQETMKERDEAQHDAQMLRIEREKLLVLQHNKDEELNHCVEDIINIKRMVSGQLNIMKTNMPKMSPPESISDVLNTSSDSDDYTSTSRCQPVCSSPTSTASGLAPVEDVWQDVSTILPEQTRSSPEVLISINAKKTEETGSPTEFKSIGRDTWQSTHPAAQGEACIPEDKPPQPHSTVLGPRPSIDHNVAGDHQWTGAAAVTQELQQNVQELFKFLNSKPPISSSTEAVSSARTVATSASSVPSSRQISMPMQSVTGSSRNFHFQMSRLPDPPKFLETPEFSDFSSYHGSIADSSSVESIDAVLKELQKNDKKRKGK